MGFFKEDYYFDSGFTTYSDSTVFIFINKFIYLIYNVKGLIMKRILNSYFILYIAKLITVDTIII